ncbi:MAG: amino acid decarboxylase [Desulfobacteraceae bacterium]|nr:MAG: amino acid decarboxylase [Desulfobacteraceae bacterium]
MTGNDNSRAAHDILDWVLSFLEDNEGYRVWPDMVPGQIYRAQPDRAPLSGKSLDTVFDEFKTGILPGITHWNHPGFAAYFNSSATLPSVMAEAVSAAVNTNTMLWKSSPAGTEIEQKTLDWLQKMLGLTGFTGITYDGGSASSFHALAAMRENFLGPEYRKAGLFGLTGDHPVIYLTEQTHNSIHKALITLGFGTDSFQYVRVNDDFSMDTLNLCELIASDKRSGRQPACVVATLGSTSCTALDPVDDIAKICREEGVWLHVDAAHGGSAAVLPEVREKFDGWEKADSIVVNPHKWLFIPLELSVLFVREPGVLKNAFHFSAEYLKTKQDGRIESYMDYGIPLGRRFRCLKLWFSLNYHGIDFYRRKIEQHLSLARLVYDALDRSEDFEIMAPQPLSTTCFRALPGSGEDADSFNERLMDAINGTGRFFISHTRLNNRFVLRHVVSGVKVTEKHIQGFLSLLMEIKQHMDN